MHKIMAAGDGPPCLKNALHFSITRSFLHRKWWLNDPDCVILPGTGLTSSEMILQLTIICMSGGVVVISEDMPSLDLNNFTLLKKILPTSQLVCGQPRNVLLHRFPKLYVCSGSDPSQRSSLFAFINWESFNVTLNTKVDLEDELRYISNTASDNFEDGVSKEVKDIFSNFFFFDFWKERTLRDDLMLHMKPHSTRALIATLFDGSQYPKLIGNSFHLIAMVDGRISGEISRDTNQFIVSGKDIVCEMGKLWIAMPTSTAATSLHKEEIFSNVSVNIVSTVESRSHKGWSIVQLSVDTSENGNDGEYKDGKWYIKVNL